MPQIEQLLPGVPNIESPFFDALFESTDAATLKVARDLHVDGFAVIDFPEPEFEQLAQDVRADLDPTFDWVFWREQGHAQGISLRAQDAWRTNEAVKRIACNTVLIDLLTRLYGKPAWPFQTLNFPVGTQQHIHTDSVHFSSVPERFMCGVWVALEDTDADNGPLVYYPGSHRWPVYTNEHIGQCASLLPRPPTQALYEPLWRALVRAHGGQPRYFHARKGQALIWAANLLHGGARQNDAARTRWSQVTHYFFGDCAYYTPMLSDPAYGRTDFRSLTNIATGQSVPHMYAGHAVPQAYIDASSGVTDWASLSSFDAKAYLAANPDVAAAGVNAAEHYLLFGIKERRSLAP